MKRSAQEQRVKAGLTDLSDGGLGDTLRKWNDDYFSQRGLFVHLELSESVMKNPGQKSKAFRKSAFLYSKREDRERKRDERKFVIVVTRLDNDGQPTEALHELDLAEKGPVEIGSSEVTSSTIPELPGDQKIMPVELPAPEPSSIKNTIEPPSGYVEMDSDNTLLLEKMDLKEKPEHSPTNSEEELMPEPLTTKWESRGALDR